MAKKDHGNHLMKKLIESYLEDYVLVLYTHEIYGHHLYRDIHKYYLQHGIHQSKYYLQNYFETCPIVSNITTNCPKAHCKYL